jgi:hypothetical protein
VPTADQHSPAFDESVQALTTHPVIVGMAADLYKASPAMLATLTHDDGGPNTRLMALANDRFAELTGQSAPFLGTVPRAVLAALAVLRDATAEEPQPTEMTV